VFSSRKDCCVDFPSRCVILNLLSFNGSSWGRWGALVGVSADRGAVCLAAALGPGGGSSFDVVLREGGEGKGLKDLAGTIDVVVPVVDSHGVEKCVGGGENVGRDGLYDSCKVEGEEADAFPSLGHQDGEGDHSDGAEVLVAVNLGVRELLLCEIDGFVVLGDLR